MARGVRRKEGIECFRMKCMKCSWESNLCKKDKKFSRKVWKNFDAECFGVLEQMFLKQERPDVNFVSRF